jgi:type II secretory ATPase GspE/PulE/Tfp pilus assembly ATPase PilB-like protein
MPEHASTEGAWSKSSPSISTIESVATYADGLISSACEFGASDIHIDPKSEYTDVKFRISGKLAPYDRFIKAHHEEFIGRIKILSKLRTDVHDKNQDGRFYFDNASGRSGSPERVDLRVSILPTCALSSSETRS